MFYLPEGTVSLDYVLIDIGGNFDKGRGAFTAPKAGKYMFMADGLGIPNGQYGDIYFKVNGEDIKQIVEQDHDYYYGVNGIVVTSLKKGDVVTLYIYHPDTIRGDSIVPFTIIGTLLSEI